MVLDRDSRLGRFVIRQRIGAGGMGTVYRAFDTVLLREVAIKTMMSDTVVEGDALVRFRREALAISQLDDPHIVKIIDLVEGHPSTDEPPYIVMELLRGENLQALIKRGPVDIPRLVDIMLQVCAAVGACHVRGFVHRDLKATNIFLTEYNRIETAKVLDFGVAKLRSCATGATASSAEVTRNGMVFGTLEYLAPEIFLGLPAAPATDQYALSVLLYTGLTGGRKPFEVAKELEHPEVKLWREIVAAEHLPVRAHHAAVPEGLEDVAERAMSRDPEARFPSVHALGEALLPWASERARFQWTVYFQTSPKPPPVHSIPFRPEHIEYARQILGYSNATGPTGATAGAYADDADSKKVGDRTTVVARHEVASGSRREGVPIARAPFEESIILTTGALTELQVQDAAHVAGALDSATTISAPSLTGSSPGTSGHVSRLGRAKPALVLLSAVAAIVSLGIVVFPIRRRDTRRPRVTPPAEIANARALRTPPRIENGSVALSTQPPTIETRSGQQDAPANGRRSVPPRNIRRRQHHRLFDRNGIGIPSD
jgi:serine/threonine-protein kinase